MALRLQTGRLVHFSLRYLYKLLNVGSTGVLKGSRGQKFYLKPQQFQFHTKSLKQKQILSERSEIPLYVLFST